MKLSGSQARVSFFPSTRVKQSVSQIGFMEPEKQFHKTFSFLNF